MGLIQTPDQLYFSYQAIIEGMKRMNNSVSTAMLCSPGLNSVEPFCLNYNGMPQISLVAVPFPTVVRGV